MATGFGIERVLQRVRNQIENGSYYEAQQSYKTLHHRYKAKNQLKESYKVLEEGASLLLEKGQVNGGLELGNLLLETYEENEVEIDEILVAGFRKMVFLLPKPRARTDLSKNSAEVKASCRFIDSIIRWLKKKDRLHEWFMEFNSLAGDYLFEWEGIDVLGRTTIYYVRARNWKSLSNVLLRSMERANASEEDLFLCRAVLQILLYATNQPVHAAATFLRCHEENKPIPKTPLMNFTYFLIEALQIPSERLVNTLTSQYIPELSRDKHLEDLLKKIKATKFGSGPSGLLANFLRDFMTNTSS